MIIFQISPMRMGSTWQFNVIRELLMAADINFKSCYWDGTTEPTEIIQETADVMVIKSHFFDSQLIFALHQITEVKVLLSLRNLNDSVHSFLRVRPDEDQLLVEKRIDQTLDLMNLIINSDMKYQLTLLDDLRNEAEYISEVNRISEFLDLGVASEEFTRISSNLDKIAVTSTIKSALGTLEDFNFFDEVTLWHVNHVGNNLEHAEYLSNPIELIMDHLAEKYERVKSRALVCKSSSSVNNRPINFAYREKIRFIELTQQRDELTHQRDELTQQRDELTQQRDELTQQRDELTQQRDELTAELGMSVAERDRIAQALTAERDRIAQALTAERDQIAADRDATTAKLEALVNSRIWRFTKFYRESRLRRPKGQ
jgi:hypothetical protein